MLSDELLVKIKGLKSAEICTFIEENREKLSEDDLVALTDVIIEKEDIVALNWCVENLDGINAEKIDKAFSDMLYKYPLHVETLTEEECKALMEVVEEYKNLNKVEKTINKR